MSIWKRAMRDWASKQVVWVSTPAYQKWACCFRALLWSFFVIVWEVGGEHCNLIYCCSACCTYNRCTAFWSGFLSTDLCDLHVRDFLQEKVSASLPKESLRGRSSSIGADDRCSLVSSFLAPLIFLWLFRKLAQKWQTVCIASTLNCSVISAWKFLIMWFWEG